MTDSEQRESVDYDLVRKGMDAAEQAARESRIERSGLRPGLWALLLLAIVVLLTSLISRI